MRFRLGGALLLCAAQHCAAAVTWESVRNSDCPAPTHASAKQFYETGLDYEYGYARVQDFARAAGCYKKAQQAGYAPAIAALARLYYNGELGPRDYKKAFVLFSSAAAHGEIPAMDAAAFMLANGRGSGLQKSFRTDGESRAGRVSRVAVQSRRHALLRHLRLH